MLVCRCEQMCTGSLLRFSLASQQQPKCRYKRPDDRRVPEYAEFNVNWLSQCALLRHRHSIRFHGIRLLFRPSVFALAPSTIPPAPRLGSKIEYCARMVRDVHTANPLPAICPRSSAPIALHASSSSFRRYRARNVVSMLYTSCLVGQYPMTFQPTYSWTLELTTWIPRRQQSWASSSLA